MIEFSMSITGLDIAGIIMMVSIYFQYIQHKRNNPPSN
jgi:hypothetical protein